MGEMDDMPNRKNPRSRPDRPVSVSRRAILKAGTASLPVILSLQSGAALARSSNLVSSAPTGTRDPATGDAICMDSSTLTPLGEGQYDLGPNGYANVDMLPEQEYYVSGTGRKDGPYTADDVCATSEGYFSYHDGLQWNDIYSRQGIIISAGAYTSVSTNGLNEIIVNYLS